jgi:hypothetical protein
MRTREIGTGSGGDLGCSELSIADACGLKVVDHLLASIELGQRHDWR